MKEGAEKVLNSTLHYTSHFSKILFYGGGISCPSMLLLVFSQHGTAQRLCIKFDIYREHKRGGKESVSSGHKV